ncbi:MAG: hypothetical protein ABIR55_08855 [Burkholderiaceae bacterium]
MGDDIETLLKSWGLYYGERPRPERSSRTVEHTLARAMTFAECKPGKAVNHATRQLVGRDGTARRRIMGKAAGLGTLERPGLVPMCFVDPVPVPSGSGGGGSDRSSERPVPKALQIVEVEVKALEQIHLVRALCLRAHYCVEGDRDARCEWVTTEVRKFSRHAKRVELTQFKNEVAFAKVWMQARLCA